MSLRDRQRAYDYDRLDELLPGLRQRYQRTFGDRYACTAPNADRLRELFEALCPHYGMATHMEPSRSPAAKQMSLF